MPTTSLTELTPREREVLSLIAAGFSNEAIRGQLWIADKTLERHVSNIYGKLGLRPGAPVHRRVLAALAWRRAEREAGGVPAFN